MTDYLNTKIVKDQLPAGPIIKSKKESGILTDGNSVDVYTDNGLRRIWLDSRIWLEGNPVANQDTIGVMSNPSNNSSVRFKLGADGNQELETSTGSLEFKPLSKNSPWFQKNLDRIREVISKARFNTDPEDELRWRSQYEACGGKVLKDLTGALVFPKGETTYISPQGRQTILNKKLEGKQLPQGSVVKQTVNGLPGDLNNFGELQAGQTGYSRIIKYGATPMQNDTVYTRTNPYGLGFENTPEGNKQGFNSLYYKKHGGRLMRQGGKIIEIPFENK